MFLHLSVCPEGGRSASVHAGIPPAPPRGAAPPSGSRHTPPQQTTNVADGTHPTEMHSCYIFRYMFHFVLHHVLPPTPPSPPTPNKHNETVPLWYWVVFCLAWLYYIFLPEHIMILRGNGIVLYRPTPKNKKQQNGSKTDFSILSKMATPLKITKYYTIFYCSHLAFLHRGLFWKDEKGKSFQNFNDNPLTSFIPSGQFLHKVPSSLPAATWEMNDKNDFSPFQFWRLNPSELYSIK